MRIPMDEQTSHGGFWQHLLRKVAGLPLVQTAVGWVVEGHWNPPLLYAAAEGDERRIRRSLARAVTARGCYGRTALHEAAAACHEGVVRLLIGAGADANAGDTLQRTPLHCAAEGGSLPIVHALLDAGADKAAQDDDGAMLLHHAARGGSLEVVRWLLDAGVDVDARTNHGATPLAWSIVRTCGCGVPHFANPEVTRLLLERGAAADATTIGDWTLLHLAASVGQLEIAGLVLDQGADPNPRAEQGDTPLLLAVRGNDAAMARLLLERGADISARLPGISRGPRLAAAVVTEGGDATPGPPLALNLHRAWLEETACWSALHLAVTIYGASWPQERSQGRDVRSIETLRVLLEHGAEATVAAAGGLTPLHLAAWRGAPGAVSLLLAHGTEISAKTPEGITPLHLAFLHRRNAETVRLLIGAGADPLATDCEGRTPLQWAALMVDEWSAEDLRHFERAARAAAHPG